VCQLFTWACTNQTNWLVRSCNILDARKNHRHTWTHKINHGLDLGETTTFPPYSIFCDHPQGLIQMSSCLGTPNILEDHNFLTSCVDFWLMGGWKQSCRLCWELSNDMLHTTCTHVFQGDSRLLMVRNQIGNLTPNLFFGHNLCLKYPNGPWKPILDIHVSRAFQWYNFKKSNEFWPLKLLFVDLKVLMDSNSQSGSPFGSVWVFSITLYNTLMSMKCDSQASIPACTFASPCFGCELKAKVRTLNHFEVQ
jgi:hypothetical protein